MPQRTAPACKEVTVFAELRLPHGTARGGRTKPPDVTGHRPGGFQPKLLESLGFTMVPEGPSGEPRSSRDAVAPGLQPASRIAPLTPVIWGLLHKISLERVKKMF